MKALVALLFIACAALVTPAVAAVPSLMSYQGRVSDSSGALIGATNPENRHVTFKFYATSTGGTPLYAEAQTVTISAGEFSVLLGAGNGVATFKGPAAPATTPYITLQSIMTGDVYLGIIIDASNGAAGTEIAPRQQIVSAAYAFRAKFAEGLLDGALNTAMIATTSVTSDKIAGAAVTSAKIAANTIATGNIATGAVTDTVLASNSVTNVKIAANAITTDKIADGQVTGADLAPNSVTSDKIADGAVGSLDIGDGQVATVDLTNAAVTNAKIADGAVDLNKLAAAIQQSLVPAGSISAYGGDSAPSGWLLCDGTLVSRSTYPNLFTAIGTRFGYTDGSNFRLPDLRGRFLRGRDGGAGRDPDRNSRGAMNANGSSGDNVGSVQDDMFRSHRHSVPNDGAGGNVDQNSLMGSNNADEAYSYTPGTGWEGGNETRPVNAYVNFIIKQ